MLNSGLPSRVYYTAWDKENQVFVSDDEANHTIQLILDGGVAAAPTNAPTSKGNGLYEIVLTDAERTGVDLALSGVSATANIILQPMHYTNDQRWGELLEDDGGGNLRNTAKSLEQAPDSVADTTGLALETSVQQVLTEGGTGPWGTADVSDLALESSVQQVLTTGGTGPWTYGIADTSGLALETSVQQILTTGGTGPWTAYDDTALSSDVSAIKDVTDKIEFWNDGANDYVQVNVAAWQQVVLTGTSMVADNGGGQFQWTVIALELAPSGGGGGEADWTIAERQHIRHRLGIDGSAVEPAATPSLALEASVQDVLTTGGAGPWTTGVFDATGLALESSVQQIITTGGTGPWTTGSGGDPTEGKDWTDAERNQIRFRLGVDGVMSQPIAEPDLAQESDLENLDVNVVSWGGSTGVVDTFALTQSSIVMTTVDTTTTASSSTTFDTPLVQTDPDHFKNRSVIMLSGALAFQASVITGYELIGGKGQLTVAGFTRAPGQGDQLIIV